MFSYKIDSCLFLSQFISEAANYILELMVWVGLVWCGLRVMDQRPALGNVLWPPTISLRTVTSHKDTLEIVKTITEKDTLELVKTKTEAIDY